MFTRSTIRAGLFAGAAALLLATQADALAQLRRTPVSLVVSDEATGRAASVAQGVAQQ